jgi:hypothetical protein
MARQYCPSVLALVCILAGAALAGCSRTPAGLVPVTGRVTLDGEPLAGAVVTFQPLGSAGNGTPALTGSVGRTDSQGRFELRLIEPDVPGAAIGRHAVTITTATATGDDAALPSGERVPKVWRNGSQIVEVPKGGTQSARFDLKGT